MGCCGTQAVVIKEQPIGVFQAVEETPITEASPVRPKKDLQFEEMAFNIASNGSNRLIQPRDISPIKKKPQYEVTYSKHKVMCDTYETMLNLWVNKGETLKFRVEGKWQPNPSLPECDSKGFATYTMEDFNYGALIGRILGEKYFNITNLFVYISPIEGPLLMKMYSPKFQLKSQGELTVFIYGGTLIKQSEVDRRIGWVLNQIRTNINKFSFSTTEESILINMNKIRVNPQLYIKLYISQYRVLTINSINTKGQLIALKVSWKLIGLLKEYWEIFGRQRSTEKMTRQQQIELFLRDREVFNFAIIAQEYEDTSSHKIFLKMLQSNDMRELIFESKYDEVGIKAVTEGNKVTFIIVWADVKDYVYRGGDAKEK